MQSWGHSSRFERRVTALHPTRSGILGLVAAAMGIDKFGENEANDLARFQSLRVITVNLPKRNKQGENIIIRRLEDYHTVTGIRRANDKVDKEATVLTYRHYLMDARFGVLLEGPYAILNEIAIALKNPRWGIWLGRKCCVPSTPVLVDMPGERSSIWRKLLQRAGYSGTECLEHFDHTIESTPNASGADMIEDFPMGYGCPIGQRHAPRWIKRIHRQS
jgi:CRISPR system Cascade subunit CasD